MATCEIVGVATTGLVKVCSYCLKVMDADGDASVDLLSDAVSADAALSHGCCNSCLADQREQLAAVRAARAVRA